MVSWRQRIRILEEIIEKQQKEIEELKRRLLAYENPHTPSSKIRNKPPKKESNGKLGAPKGHPKYEREEPEPTGSVEYIEDTCPHCNSTLGNPFKTDRILEEEIPKPQPVEVIEHLVNHYTCPHCKSHIIADNNAPQGRFGKNVLTHVTLLKYDDRLPLRKTVSSLKRHYGLELSNVCAMKLTEKVAKKLNNPYKCLIKKIRKSKIIYVDETELRVDGITHHLWTFVTDKEVLFVIRRSRGKQVIEEILGTSYKGVICCDGWHAYSQYSSNLQRCWVHIIREAKDLAKKYTEFEGFYTTFKRMFARIKKAQSYLYKTRLKWRNKLIEEMKQLIENMKSYTEFRKFSTKVENGLDYWFTCLINPNVEPTNNNAERALRELIVQRKIIGGLRREKGAHTMEVITSIIGTAKKRGLNPFEVINSSL